MQILGANPNSPASGVDEMPGKSNYFIGNDPKQWRANVANYTKVRYDRMYPGVDLVYYGNQRQLEYDFVVAPGADPSRIRLKFRGAGTLRIDDKGDLVLGAGDEQVRLQKPQVYQEASGTRKIVEGSYFATANIVRFRVGDYDHSRALIIDPTLDYSTTFGGSGYDQGNGIAVDSSGNAYVAGFTASSNFPTTTGAFQTAYGGGDYDAFVTKLNATGTGLVYSTYFGGSGYDQGNGIAVDSAGNAYVTGFTASSNFPTTTGAFQTAYGGGSSDAFVTKLNATGTGLVYSTYLGGSGGDAGTGIAVDSSGNAYVTGNTNSSNFPATTGAFQATFGGYNDAFVTKLNATGTGLVYSTYFGGSGYDQATVLRWTRPGTPM